MKIVITGASGFVGKNLTRLFTQNGDEVLPLSLRKENWLLPSASAIIHLAGIEKDTGTVSNHEEYFQVNSYLTEKVYLQFLASDIKDFIFISSIKAAADFSDQMVTEENEPTPFSSYGKSKLLAEQLISKYELPSNKRLIIVRPCLIHGPEDTGNLKLLFKIVKSGVPYPLGGFSNQRSYITVQNLSFLLSEILKKHDFKSGIYNVADDHPLSTNRLIEVMYETLQKKPRIIKFPAAPINFTTKLFSKFGVKLLEEKLNKLTENFVVSNAKIKKELGIQQLPYSAEEGLINTIKSFQKEITSGTK